MKRKLTLRAEYLTELTTDELNQVVGAVGAVTLDECPATIRLDLCTSIC